MTTKKYDICAVTGEYTNSQGETKKRYLNVGAVLDSGDGPYIVLEKWFNPAGVESKFLSLFKPDGKKQSAPAPVAEEDDIPL